ncbi:MAG TPA: NAD(P)H-hydrate dehydratase [Candidatus Limnocylindria bacterium]|jgi:NAD(P)H-hydrate epimerase|nr:NAD(P)H-hydrate dehydratase [Candidatus Limnocylindria bacterium]
MALPVLSVEQMRIWEDATWATGVREADVIARVGERVAARLCELTRAGDRIVLIAGRGHNGDDVRSALAHLTGREARIINAFIPRQAVTDLRLWLGRDSRPGWIVDGMFGIGLNREIDPAWQELLVTVNEAGLPILAVDTPSGLDADTGQVRGAAVRATITLTIGAPKRGLLADSAVEFVGRLEVATEIGLLARPETAIQEKQRRQKGGPLNFPLWWSEAADFSGLPPVRPVSGHKGSFGQLALIAGSLGYHGAAVLAARAAGRGRPGLITVITSPETYLPVAAQLAAPMVRPWSQPLELPAKTTALLVGPGLAGAEVPAWLRSQIAAWWRELRLPMIADASALDWLATEPPATAAPRVITPHPGEARRWLEKRGLPTDLPRPALLSAMTTPHIWGVLKGNQTLVGNAEGPAYVNPTGNPGLAQGGTGDVLAGYLGGLLAQPAWARDPLRTLRFAVWEHGQVADRLEAARQNWTAEDLAAGLGG